MENMLNVVANLSDEELVEVAVGQLCSYCTMGDNGYSRTYTFDGNCNLC